MNTALSCKIVKRELICCMTDGVLVWWTSLLQAIERQKCNLVELVTRLGSLTVSACHRIVVSADNHETKAGELAVGDRETATNGELAVGAHALSTLATTGQDVRTSELC